MKWRMAPNIDTKLIKDCKFLLIGAGTLGCHVSRCLIGWGARNIDFLDYGKVSYSNPVRQSLYNFEDSKDQTIFKADKAAIKLKEILPSINSKGHPISIPLPSRTLVDKNSEEKYFEKVEYIDNLIKESDIIFLLTDSRESRWLPTLLAKVYNKICITAAIGFDSFVVIRHGILDQQFKDENENLGCYFCNDIVSPTDTSSNRTLDQQCTISRPGISAICSGLAAELAISILQKEDRLEGIIPHSIRGNLTDYVFNVLKAIAFKK